LSACADSDLLGISIKLNIATNQRRRKAFLNTRCWTSWWQHNIFATLL
jgi:hypothetical protein